ncbi:NmrA/HSCARG family protein [Intrasporangium sp.]|uniref:NmrA/HSCARG family protein n=1 Tax=Intrasporangium sp. TaxID=1925024 RepID=UPI00293A1A81|nr:NmrA/HSCARG family protein [Intrasporangium sp.]MDV3219822.1 NmrA/HSCARG family protein [Intrasporangium sp.]
MNRSVLVTGATGAQGGAVARELLSRGHSVRALTRRPDSPAARALRDLGAEVVVGDFDQPASIREAAHGLDAAFAIGTPFEVDSETEARQVISLLDALRDAGIGHIVYSSVASALDGTGIPHFESKARAEKYLGGLGVPHTIVAPVAFLENVDMPWIAPELQQGRYPFGVPIDLPVQQVALADLASFVALAVEQPERLVGKRVELASVETTGRQIVEQLSQTLGRPVEYVELSVAMFRDSGNEDMARMLEFFRAGGYSVDVEGLRAAYPEVRWHSLRGWAEEHDWSAALGEAVSS